MADVSLIVGLGNPGPRYELTRHNAGAGFVEYLANRFGVVLRDEARFRGRMGRGEVLGHDVRLLIPTTYMNLSGRPVQSIAAYYQIPPENVIVIHDDMDLEVGRVKMVYNRGPGGHNGIKSIIDCLGTKEFVRIRLGIGRPPGQMAASAFVLSKFKEDEIRSLTESFDKILQAIRIFSLEGVAESMKFMNTK